MTKANSDLATYPIYNSTTPLPLRGLKLITLTVQKAYARASSTLSMHIF